MVSIEKTCIIEVVEEAARLFPESIAFVEHSSGRSFTYSQLLELAERLANVLKKIIIYPEAIVDGSETPLVAILTERSLVSVVSILAILKARAAYVPVDPSFPDDRQEHIFSHSKCQLAIIDQANGHRLEGVKGVVPRVILMNNQTGEVDESDEANILTKNLHEKQLPALTDMSLSYVLYTSGSTGKPKGVMVRNKGLLNVVQFFVDLLKIDQRDRVLCLTTLCFDISMLELFMPLISGATLVMVTATTQKNPIKILDCVKERNITVMQATPTTYEMLIACGWNGDMNIRFLVGGEACRPKVAALAPYCKALYNVYGPTETSIWSSFYLLPSHPEGVSSNIPVGAPLWKTSFYIVTEDGRDVTESGEEGELWIGGDGVALGYLHAPELTVQRFLKNPFGPGEVYRTGDLFRKMEDGNFIFLRRMDDQVKLNGYRIELAEVEIALSDHEAVEQAVVIVKDNALWGFVKLNHNASQELKNTKNLTKVLQAFGRKKLTPYMIPKLIIEVEDFPKTANGKLDRLSLSKMDLTPYLLSTEEEKVEADVDVVKKDTAELGPPTTLVGFVKAQVMKQSGQMPSSSSTFAAVGIDSLAAMMFRSVLSQSLGGLKIDPDVLYDPSTTIESLSIDLYNRLQKENPSLLLQLGITAATDAKDLEEGGSDEKKTEDVTLGRFLLQRRNWLEGLRGICITLVVIDHFYWKNAVGGKRMLVDTVLFLIISGFTAGLQDIAQLQSVTTSDVPKEFVWDPLGFIYSRFVGLFPIYWLCLFFSIPLLLVQYYDFGLSAADFTGMIILYVLGLQTWSHWSDTAMRYCYFVSLIWSVFIVYAMFKTVILTKVHIALRLFAISCLVGFLIGMYAYNSGGGFHPPIGTAYFLLGFVAATAYSKLQYWFLKPTTFQQGKEYFSLPQQSSDGATRQVVEVWKYLPSILLDVFAFAFFFIIFYNGFHGDNTTSSPVMIHTPTSYESRHTKEYRDYDTWMKLIGLPILFSFILITGFLQPKSHEYSIFGYILSQTKIFVLLGECSLAIYIFHQLFVNFYWSIGIAGIQHGQFPYTRNFPYKVEDWVYWKHIGLFISILIGIFIQKIYQDKFITALHLNLMNYISNKKVRDDSVDGKEETALEKD